MTPVGDRRIAAPDGTEIAVHVEGHENCDRGAVVWVDPAGGFSGMRPLQDAVGSLSRLCAVHTYDRRGRGASGDRIGQDSTVADEVADLAAVVDAIEPADGPVTVLGFSSGAALALHAAASGLVGRRVSRVVALEPAVDLDGGPDATFLGELRSLVDGHRRGDAVLFFQRSIGVPEELVEQLPHHPAWTQLQALAHTFLYDAAVTDTLSRDVLGRIRLHVDVVASRGSDEFLRRAAVAVARATPGSAHVELPGQWHGPDTDALVQLVIDG